ncbi:unnamed protein product [Schistocephalus solidus]|uniref:Uncharacterized protein n=1 Tax=Schistocephalus solidus TaxID=70667 RepID=A0A3P7DGD6_SCHSO|nr:unnamed protein product [Schistocephalus solidus]
MDLRGVPILLLDAQVLGQGIRGQFTTTRVNLRKSVTNYLNQRHMGASKQLTKESDTALVCSLTKSQKRHVNDIIRRFFTSPSGKTEVQAAEVAAVLVDVPNLCLRGLHLGETGISGPSLSELTAAIRIAGQLSDLRLPSNGLQSSDVKSLVNLLRFYAGLEVLDLSYNQIGPGVTTESRRPEMEEGAGGSDPTGWECHKSHIKKEPLQPDSQSTGQPLHTKHTLG